MKPAIGYFAFLLVCGTSGFVLGEDDPTPAPEDIIHKAIDAHGGQEALANYAHFRVRSKGVVYYDNKSAPMTVVCIFLDQNHTKVIAEVETRDAGLVTETTVFNEKKVWIKRNGTTSEISDTGLQVARVEAYDLHVRNLLPILDKSRFILAPLPAVKIIGKDAVGVRVSSKGYPDINLYFDKKTWMLIKKTRGKEKSTNDAPTQEELFEEYKRQKGGFMCCTKRTIMKNGKKRFEVTLLDVEPLTEVDDSSFSKP